MDHKTTAKQFQDLLGLRSPPVAVTFRPTPPEGVPRVDAAGPSGCSYWNRAAEGRTFYTVAEDHYNCPIGSHTHGIDLPPEQAKNLQGLLETMVGLGYLRMEEVPSIPRLRGRFGVAVYGPLAEAAGEPDVVLVRGNARQVMLLAEAAQAAGVEPESGLLGRPTCAALPASLGTQRCVSSLGCIGNRVYTELGDDELYFALPGRHAAAVAQRLAVIVNANRQLESYHRARVARVEG